MLVTVFLLLLNLWTKLHLPGLKAVVLEHSARDYLLFGIVFAFKCIWNCTYTIEITITKKGMKRNENVLNMMLFYLKKALKETI